MFTVISHLENRLHRAHNSTRRKHYSSSDVQLVQLVTEIVHIPSYIFLINKSYRLDSTLPVFVIIRATNFIKYDFRKVLSYTKILLRAQYVASLPPRIFYKLKLGIHQREILQFKCMFCTRSYQKSLFRNIIFSLMILV